MKNKKLIAGFVIFFLFGILYLLRAYVLKMPKNFTGLYFNVSNKISNEITMIIVVNNDESVTNDYSISIPTIQCYAQTMDYNLLIIDFSKKHSFPSKCNMKCRHCPENLAKTAEVKFSRHCIIAEYLINNPKTKYVIALDADTGVINPHHRIEDYIYPSFDLIFHERRYNFEIQAATYIAKNSKYTISFLNSWAKKINEIPITIENADNPALHQVLMEHNHSDMKKNYGDTQKFIYCTRQFLGFNASYCCNNRIKIFLANDQENVAWSRDGWLTKTQFSYNDFMFHDWKTGDLEKPTIRSFWQNPFSFRAFSETRCWKNNTNSQWKYLPGFKIRQSELNFMLKQAQDERRQYSKIKYIEENEVLNKRL